MKKEGRTWHGYISIHSFIHPRASNNTVNCCISFWNFWAFIRCGPLIRIHPFNAMPCEMIELNWIDVDRAYVIGFHVSFSSHFIRWDRNGHLHGSWSGLLSYPAAAVAISWNHSNHWPIHFISFTAVNSLWVIFNLGGLDLFYRWKNLFLIFISSLSLPLSSHLSPPPLPFILLLPMPMPIHA